jgi:hypothetical protein
MNNAVYNDPASIQAAEGIFGNQVARQNTVAPVNQLVPQPAVNLGVTQPVDTAAVATKATAQQVDPTTGLLLQPTVPNQNIR